MGSWPSDEYRLIAPVYDLLVEPFLRSIRGDVARIARSHRFGTILDLCCGTGSQARLLDAMGFRVAGVDISPSMLRVAKAKGPGSIRYYLEDASNLHFADASFDCVVLSLALHEKPSDLRSRIVQEAKRVLRGGGRIVIVDYAPVGSLTSMIGVGIAHAVERGAGAAHYSCFRQYMKSHALAGVLRDNCLQPFYTGRYFLETIALVVAGWQDGSQ